MREDIHVGLFSKRTANQVERQVWGLVNTTDEIMSLVRQNVETYIGPTTEEYDRLERDVFAAASEFNRAYDAKEWTTIGNQNDAWKAAMNAHNAYMVANDYEARIEAHQIEEDE